MLVVLILFLELGLFVVPTLRFSTLFDQHFAAVLPGVLASLTNEERSAQSLPTLSVNPLLTQAAQLKAEDMAKKEYFAHTSPEGLTPWHWLEQVGYEFDYAGENLAVNFTDSEDVTNAWMESPTHKANIVKAAYTEVGTGIATGTYKGKETVFVAQVYAHPAQRPAPTIPVPAPERTKLAQVPQTSPTNVLGAELTATPKEEKVATQTAVTSEPSFLDKALASPRHTFNFVLGGFMCLVLFALILNVAIKINIQHPDLITNGLAVVAIVGAVFVGNNFLARGDVVISESINYSFEEVAEI